MLFHRRVFVGLVLFAGAFQSIGCNGSGVPISRDGAVAARDAGEPDVAEIDASLAPDARPVEVDATAIDAALLDSAAVDVAQVDSALDAAFMVDSAASVDASISDSRVARADVIVADVVVADARTILPAIAVSTTSVRTTETGGAASIKLRLSAQPSAPVTIAVSSSDLTEAVVTPSAITFTASDWTQEKSITVTGLDDMVDDGDVQYAVVLAAAASADPAYSGFDPVDVTGVNVNNDRAGVVIAPSGPLMTSEPATSTTFTVSLASEPKTPVVINLASSDATEGRLSETNLFFFPDNWSEAKTVTLIGVDDTILDGAQSYRIILTISSPDTAYAQLTVPPILANNGDNERAPATLVVSPTTGVVTSESGVSARLSVSLGSQPTAEVRVAISSSNTDEVAVSPAWLSFSPTNWSQPRVVTLRGVDDFAIDGDRRATVSVRVESTTDPLYQFATTVRVSVTNEDDE